MKRIMKGMSLLLVLALLLGTVPARQADAAAKKMKLSKTKLTLKVGQSKELKVKNKKGKVKWKSSKKKVATVSKKGIVRGKKAGKATIKAEITYKKKKTTLKCKVTVEPKKTVTPTSTPKKDTSTPTSTPKKDTPTPTPKKDTPTPTPTPKEDTPTPTPTPKEDAPTPTPTPKEDTPTPTPTPTPKKDTPTFAPTQSPSPVPTLAPRRESTITDNEIKNATRGDFVTYRMGFEYLDLTYQLLYNTAYVTLEKDEKLNEVLPESEVSKLNATVRLRNDEDTDYEETLVDDVRISNIQWHEEMDGGWDWVVSVDGYYSCRIYAKTESGVYFCDAAIGGISEDYGIADNQIKITGVEYNGKMLDGTGADSQFYVNTEENQTIQDLIPDPSLVKIHFNYLKKEYTVKPDMQWVEESWYEWVEGREAKDKGYYLLSISTQDGSLLIKGDGLALVEHFPYLYIDSCYDPTTNEKFWTGMGKAVEYSFFDTSGKETLQEVFEDDLSKLEFVCIYKNKKYENVGISDVVWHKEPYYSNGNDNGYYSFTLTVTTQDGKKVTEEFVLVEPESFVQKHTVTGRITAADNTPLANMEFQLLYEDDEDIEFVTVKTDSNGDYKVRMASRHYTVYADGYNVAEIDVDDGTETLDIHFKNHYLLQGTLKRGNRIWPEAWVYLTSDDGQGYSFSSNEEGKICTLLPKNTYKIFVMSYETGQSVTVDSSNLSWELVFDLFEVKGSLTRQNGDKLNNRGFALKKEGEDAGQLFADEDGNYSVYLEPGEYSVIYEEASFQIDTITVTDQDITKNFSIPLAEITIDVTRFGTPYDEYYLICVEGTGEEMWTGFVLTAENMGNGKYKILVPYNKTVTLLAQDGSYEKEVSVTTEDQEIAIALDRYKIQGKVIRTDADSAPMITNQSLKLVQEKEEIPFFVYEDGSYSVLAGEGTWQVVLEGSGVKLGEITVTSDNDNQIIEVTGVIRVYGTITFDGAPYSYYSIVYNYIKDDLPIEAYTSTDGSGCYETYVPAGVTLRFNVADKTYDYTVTAETMDQEFNIAAQTE